MKALKLYLQAGFSFICTQVPNLFVQEGQHAGSSFLVRASSASIYTQNLWRLIIYLHAGSVFMSRAAAMTQAGVILGSSLVRPLPLYPHQPPRYPPTSMMVKCSTTSPPSPSSPDTHTGGPTPTLYCKPDSAVNTGVRRCYFILSVASTAST